LYSCAAYLIIGEKQHGLVQKVRRPGHDRIESIAVAPPMPESRTAVDEWWKQANGVFGRRRAVAHTHTRHGSSDLLLYSASEVDCSVKYTAAVHLVDRHRQTPPDGLQRL